MSRPHVTVVTCPVCGSEQQITLWDSINSTLSPKLKRSLLKGEINVFRCLKCKKKTHIENNLLYNDMEAEFMIWLKYDDEGRGSSEDVQGEALLQGLAHGYRLRVVSMPRQLAEKILIFDHKLDDRIIEFLKVLIWKDYSKSDNAPENCLFYQRISKRLFGKKELIFAIFEASGNLISCSIPWEDYLKATNIMHEYLNDDFSGGPRCLAVNRDYALQLGSRMM